MSEFEISFLGTRGTAPACGPLFTKYGGDTMCVLVRVAQSVLLLDAGTGLLSLTEKLLPHEKKLHILLSHMHIDHIIGLTAADFMYDPTYEKHFYIATRDGVKGQQQLERMISPPLWPISTKSFANTHFHELSDGVFEIDGVSVTTAEGNHPQGCKFFRLDFNGKSLVYITDYEHSDEAKERIVKIADGVSLLLIDGHYTTEEYERFLGYGHCTYEQAAQLGVLLNAMQTKIIHHSPRRTDAQLEIFEKELCERYSNISFAKQSEEVAL